MEDLISLAQAKARRHGVPAPILLALVEIESGFRQHQVRFQKNNPWVYGEKAFAKKNGITVETENILQHFDYGFCQIPGSTARSMGYPGHLFRMLEPHRNLEFGAACISGLLKEHGLEGAAAAYGTGTAKKPFQNQGYVNRFMDALRKWEKDLWQPISGL